MDFINSVLVFDFAVFVDVSHLFSFRSKKIIGPCLWSGRCST